MSAKQRVALISLDEMVRGALARYLTDVGFEVEEHAELALPAGFSAVVLIADNAMPSDKTAAQVRSWLKATKPPRVVVVTSKPTVLRELALAHPGRLVVLAAPAFGWHLVDALRAAEAPRGA